MPETDKIMLRHFSSFYGDQPALKEIDLNIRARQIFAFLGPARSGKTTLLKSLNRLTDLILSARHTGDIFIDNTGTFSLPRSPSRTCGGRWRTRFWGWCRAGRLLPRR